MGDIHRYSASPAGKYQKKDFAITGDSIAGRPCCGVVAWTPDRLILGAVCLLEDAVNAAQIQR
jgi:hypothetical protein